jgi:hypothetical protein
MLILTNKYIYIYIYIYIYTQEMERSLQEERCAGGDVASENELAEGNVQAGV